MLRESHLIILKMLSVSEKHRSGDWFVINAERSSIFHCAKKSFLSFVELENPSSEPSWLPAGTNTHAHATKIRIRVFNRKMQSFVIIWLVCLWYQHLLLSYCCKIRKQFSWRRWYFFWRCFEFFEFLITGVTTHHAGGSNTFCVIISAVLSFVFIYFCAVRKLWTGCMHLHPERIKDICCGASCHPSAAHRVFGGVPADCREILLPLMTDQLKFHLEKEEELQACCQLLSDILEVLYRKDVVRMWIFYCFNGFQCPAMPEQIIFYSTDHLLTFSFFF